VQYNLRPVYVIHPLRPVMDMGITGPFHLIGIEHVICQDAPRALQSPTSKSYFLWTKSNFDFTTYLCIFQCPVCPSEQANALYACTGTRDVLYLASNRRRRRYQKRNNSSRCCCLKLRATRTRAQNDKQRKQEMEGAIN
jgi:hypothetical protein